MEKSNLRIKSWVSLGISQVSQEVEAIKPDRTRHTKGIITPLLPDLTWGVCATVVPHMLTGITQWLIPSPLMGSSFDVVQGDLALVDKCN